MAKPAEFVTEIALTVQFAPFDQITFIDLAELHGLFRPEFPIVQQVPRSGTMSLNEQSSVMQLISPTFAELLPRVWFLSDDLRRLIQFQNDRFSYNWRRISLDDQVQYPGYEAVSSDFFRLFSVVSQWFFAKYGSAPITNICELLYNNAIPLIRNDGNLRLSDVFSFYNSIRPNQPAIRFNAQWGELTDNPTGFISVSAGVVPGLDGAPIAQIGLDCKFDAAAPDSSLRSGFDSSHGRLLDWFRAAVKSD